MDRFKLTNDDDYGFIPNYGERASRSDYRESPSRGRDYSLNLDEKSEEENRRFRLDNNFNNNLPIERVEDVTIFFIAPREHHAHMVRPHTYNFEHYGCIEMLEESFVRNEPLISRANIETEPLLNSMIKPSQEGHTIRLEDLSDRWTFILIEHRREDEGFEAYATSFLRKTISTGYCIGEPINSRTGTHNPQCILKFCHHSSFRFTRQRNQSYSNFGKGFINVDVVPSDILSVNEDARQLVYLTPFHMQSTDEVEHATRELLGRGGRSQINKLMKFKTIEGIPKGSDFKLKSEIKSTKNHLNTILDTLQETKNAFELGDYEDDHNESIHAPRYEMDFNGMYYRNLSRGRALSTSGLTSFDTKSLHEIDSLYPNIVPKIIDPKNARKWSVYPSVVVNENNTFTAWIADMISYLCESMGILTLSFTYDSYTGNRYEKKGRWAPHNIETVHQYDYKLAVGIFQDVEREIELNVFSVLKAFRGDFVLSVHYRMMADTLLKLEFYCDDDKTDAFYEHPSHLSGLVSPNIAEVDVYGNNASQLQNFINRMSANVQHYG